MIAIRPARQSSSSFMRITESTPASATDATTISSDNSASTNKRWGRKLSLKGRGGSISGREGFEKIGSAVEERSRRKKSTERRGSKSYFSFLTSFRSQSYNAKFTVLSLVLMVLLMTGSTLGAPTDNFSSSISSAEEPTSTTTESSTTTTESAAAATTTVYTTGGTVETPTLFDTVSIGSNSTAPSCPIFFSKFLSDPVFQKCLPLSALLLNSQSYFEITTQGGFETTQVVDQTCNVNVTVCNAIMEKLGWQIGLTENCGADLALGNPVVVQARNAFIAYRPVYLAGCLKSSSGSYCYVDALTNITSPTDSYIYYLPLGQSFPGGARPTCSECLADTMRIYSAFAGNSSQPMYDTYTPASQQINMGCGPEFSNTTVAFQMSSSGRSTFSPAPLMTLLVVLLAVVGVVV